MQRNNDFTLTGAIAIALFLVCATASVHGLAQPGAQQVSPEKVLLTRMHQMRLAYERERAQKDNEARANVRLVTQSSSRGADSPTVSGLRAQTNQQLVRFEQQFRCLDVDVDNAGGNTVVICGDNSGDIEGSNVHAERDIITIPGGQP